MRRFDLIRDEDESGVSGTGLIGQGVEFDSGQVTLKWLSHLGTIGIYDNVKTLKQVHGHGGKTRIVWIDQDEHEAESPEQTSVATPTPPVEKKKKGK